MLGYCASCQTLRQIVRLPNRNRTGEIDYGATEHREPDVHRDCGGVVHWIEMSATTEVRACERCEQIVTNAEVIVGQPSCPGVRKPIR